MDGVPAAAFPAAFKVLNKDYVKLAKQQWAQRKASALATGRRCNQSERNG
jgi:hypothetical protein